MVEFGSFSLLFLHSSAPVMAPRCRLSSPVVSPRPRAPSLLLLVAAALSSLSSLPLASSARTWSRATVGHHPDLKTCKENCEATQACGLGEPCKCGCCGAFGADTDGCYCYQW